MRVALVHDALVNKGGAERVFQIFCEMFPNATIYTSVYLPNKTWPYFKTREIITTPLQKIVKNEFQLKILFPLANYFMSKLKIINTDIILSSSTFSAKYINKGTAKHFCYCYYPTRAVWESEKYFGSSILRYLVKPMLPYFKYRERKAIKRIDRFIAISKDTAKHIKRYYGRNSDIIYCPIDLDNFFSSTNRSDDYLLVSRLEKWKKIDYAIEAFNKLGYSLNIVGTGSQAKQLKKKSAKNIKFLGYLTESELCQKYSKAKAVVFTPKLEYGLIPLEAVASGTPVVAYGHGGIEETMIPWQKEDPKKSDFFTAVFYYKQDAQSLIKAIKEFETLNIDSNALINYSNKWNLNSFKDQFREYINLHR